MRIIGKIHLNDAYVKARKVLQLSFPIKPHPRLEPIMLLKLPIMLLSSAPKSSLLCSKLWPAI